MGWRRTVEAIRSSGNFSWFETASFIEARSVEARRRRLKAIGAFAQCIDGSGRAADGLPILHSMKSRVRCPEHRDVSTNFPPTTFRIGPSILRRRCVLGGDGDGARPDGRTVPSGPAAVS
jgi:hypothetical protein